MFVSNLETNDIEGTAIIGMAGRFPGAKNVAEFWQNLCGGVESISFFSDEELIESGIDPALVRRPNYVKVRGVLGDTELFDATFFGLHPREAALMDPQHRLFLECAWEAFENAGYRPDNHKGRVGVFGGQSMNTYLLTNIYPHIDLVQSVESLQASLGNDKDSLTTEVAYRMNLTGPAVTIQSSSSTSLVAAHYACQSLLSYECDMALAGGVSLHFPEKAGYLYHEGGTTSSDGHCRAFDARAEGFVAGHGAGVVVLKRLADALADGDTIYAVVKGSAVNNDGSVRVSYMAPSVSGQAEVIAMAQAIAGVEPESIGYVEAHGTGTLIGDPIEIAALTQAFRAGTDKKGFCAIGSVKPNIGHLDAAAGVVGLIKTVLVLKHKMIAPTLHFEQPNPNIDFVNSPFYVNTRLAKWEADGTPRLAGVSSFGMGGTNAHVILEEAPTVEPSGPSRPAQLLLLSAKTDSALKTMTASLADHLRQHPDLNLADVAYTLQVGRKRFDHRQMLACHDLGDAVTTLSTCDPGRIFTAFQEPKSRPITFMFSGQGSQYVNMGRELYEQQPVFREHIDTCAQLLKPHLGLDLRGVLYPQEGRAEEASAQLRQTALTQPALFAVEYALAQLWLEWRIQSQAMIGHSIGEYVAACLAGVFSLKDALALVAARGRLMQHMPGGAMLAVLLSEQEMQPFLEEAVSLAAVNGPSNCVVSGPDEAIDALQSRLEGEGINCRRLHTSHAFHSAMMEPALAPFREQVQRVRLAPPAMPYISNVTGTWVTAAEATNPDYWATHLRRTIRFSDGVRELLQDPDAILLEVGPGKTLSTLARLHIDRDSEQVTLSSLRHPKERQSDVAFLLDTVGRLWLAGVDIDWSAFYAGERRHRIPLPTYPFERERFWIEPEEDKSTRQVSSRKQPDIADWFYLPSWKRSLPPVPLGPGDLAHEKLCWLVFSDSCGVGVQMVKRLEQEGQDVITVMPGGQFAKIGDSVYTMNHRQAGDYDTLIRELFDLHKIPQIILHFCSITANDYSKSGAEPFEEFQFLGLYSMLFLVQALTRMDLHDPLEIVVLSNGLHEVSGEEKLWPEKATILGACKVIPQEYPHITCRAVDIAVLQPQSPQEAELIDQLMAEIVSRKRDPVVAYRQKHRWVQTFEPVRVEGAVIGTNKLRQGGVYLITGGLGDIGLVLAEYLARSVQAKLILTGLTGLPPRDEWAQWLAKDSAGRKLRAQESGAEYRMRVEADDVNRLEAELEAKLGVRGLESYEGLEEAINRLCSCYVYSYLSSNSVEAGAGKRYGVEELKRALRILPKFERFYDFMIRILEKDGIVEVRDGRIEFLMGQAEVGELEALKREMHENYPEFKGLFRLLDHCVSNYSKALTGKIPAISVLYPEGSAGFLEEIEKDTAQYSNEQFCFVLLGEIVSSIVRKSPGEKLRILEIGGGTGRLTHVVATALKGQNVEYYFTDLGKLFVMNEKEEALKRGLDFMKFGTFDITQSPAGQGYNEFSFDVVLGSNVVHATRSIRETVGNLKKLLAPDGILCLIEPVKPRRWIDMIWGLAEGWWYFEDIDLRFSGSPLLPVEKWEGVLGTEGYRNVRAYPQNGDKRSKADWGLVIAQQDIEIAVQGDVDWGTEREQDRTERIAKRIRKVQQLENLGPEVLVASADVADRGQMQELISQAYDRFGAINGVIHMAGTIEEKFFPMIQETGPAECKWHFGPKAYGLMVLEDVLGGRELDFCMLLSSTSSILGGLGHVAYCAANLFMDTFAYRHNRTYRTPWITLNSEIWRTKRETMQNTAFTTLAKFSMTPEEGIETIRRALSLGHVTQVVVSSGDLQARINQWIKLESLRETERPGERSRETFALHARQKDLRTAYVLPSNDVEQRIAVVWQNTLGIEQVGVHDNFFELGGDSLTGVQLVSRLNEEFDVQIPAVSLYEGPTVSALAKIIEQETGDGGSKGPAYAAERDRGQRRLEKIRRRRQMQAETQAQREAKEWAAEKSRAWSDFIEENLTQSNPHTGVVKDRIKQIYTAMNEHLANTSFEELATHFNYGYVANDQPQHSAAELPEDMLNRNTIKLVLEVIGGHDINGRKILDVGCGRGGTISTINTYYSTQGVVGLDITPTNIAFCQRRFAKGNTSFLVGDAEGLPFNEGTFDFVIDIESSCLYPNLFNFYRGVFRILRRGGYFLYTDMFNSDYLERNLEFLQGLGFVLERNQDITSNVLLSRDEIANWYVRALNAGQDETGFMQFLAAPGSEIYDSLKNGLLSYRILNLRKT